METRILSSEISENLEIMKSLVQKLGIVYYRYDVLVNQFIRERYPVDEEFAILRQRDIKPDEFAEYNAYAEQCKSKAKKIWERQENAIAEITAKKEGENNGNNK